MVTLKKPLSGIWNPQPGDLFELRKLKIMEQFFIKDLRLAKSYLTYVENFANRKLTPSKKGMSDMLGVARRDVRVSEKNLATVRRLIKDFKE